MDKYMIDTQENRDFLAKQMRELLRFGCRFPSPGGGAYYLGDDGTPCKERPRETWITSRMVHVYSVGAIMGYDDCAHLADEALRGLTGELRDDKNGGWYAAVGSEGSVNDNKQCYAHAFVILAASSAMLAQRPGADDLFDAATRIFDSYFWDEKTGLTVDEWDGGFTKASSYRGLNANMHTVEAFLAAADVTSDEKYRIRAGRIIDRVIGWAKNNKWRIPEHFSKNWEVCPDLNKEKPDDPFKPYGATPGHGIEWARLIVQWAISTYGTQGSDTKEYIGYARCLYDRAVSDAWNCDGAPGLCYTTDWDGTCVVHDRMHWTLAEAINTSAILYRITGDTKYADDYAMFMEYLDKYVIDHKTGSWFHQLDKNNNVIKSVWPGKPDLYHAVQAALIPYVDDPGLSVAVAVKGTVSKTEPVV